MKMRTITNQNNTAEEMMQSMGEYGETRRCWYEDADIRRG